jgi:hypothetical protein
VPKRRLFENKILQRTSEKAETCSMFATLKKYYLKMQLSLSVCLSVRSSQRDVSP